jgi:hypothetical protein
VSLGRPCHSLTTQPMGFNQRCWASQYTVVARPSAATLALPLSTVTAVVQLPLHTHMLRRAASSVLRSAAPIPRMRTMWLHSTTQPNA